MTSLDNQLYRFVARCHKTYPDHPMDENNIANKTLTQIKNNLISDKLINTTFMQGHSEEVWVGVSQPLTFCGSLSVIFWLVGKSWHNDHGWVGYFGKN